MPFLAAAKKDGIQRKGSPRHAINISLSGLRPKKEIRRAALRQLPFSAYQERTPATAAHKSFSEPSEPSDPHLSPLHYPLELPTPFGVQRPSAVTAAAPRCNAAKARLLFSARRPDRHAGRDPTERTTLHRARKPNNHLRSQPDRREERKRETPRAGGTFHGAAIPGGWRASEFRNRLSDFIRCPPLPRGFSRAFCESENRQETNAKSGGTVQQ